MADNFPFYKQLNAMDCGAACLHMVANYYGRYYSLEYLRDLTHINIEGVSLRGISDAAEHVGFHTLGARTSYQQLVEDIPLPFIAHWRDDHFIVVYKVDKKHVWVADPGFGKLKYTKTEFLEGWAREEMDSEEQESGTILILEKSPDFDIQEDVTTDKGGFLYLWSYFLKYPRLIFQLALGLIFTTALAILFPFLVQVLVDQGISSEDQSFIGTVAITWFILLLIRIGIEYIRGWVVLHIGVRTNISLISDFIIKIVKLPMRFFDRQMTSDLVQRIYDNDRVERLLTTSTLLSLFDGLTILMMSLVLLYYNTNVFLLFVVFTFLYVTWIWLTMRRRKEYDYKRFDRLADNHNRLVELVNGMQEIKLHNAEKNRRWLWERTEAKSYYLSLQYLGISQRQQAGVTLINETKNILLIAFSAYYVINGQMSLGMLLAIMYIISQINTPINQLLKFGQNLQEAKSNLERMNEIHRREDEENPENKIDIIPENGDLYFENVSFNYEGGNTKPVLQNISCHIPKGKVTAIVGGSGSGKTTMLKLLLNFYQPTNGAVKLGDIPLHNFLNTFWRGQCGAVLQDGYIFSESIADNIGIGDDFVDRKKLFGAVKVAHIQEFIEGLPLGYNTKIGANGMGLSQGQRQRILIARAVYKNPNYVFLDEATNALDSENESLIMEKMNDFLSERTVVIVAHRLSTVREADNIIVMEKGRIVEQGKHDELVFRRGKYFRLVRNQLY